MLTNDRFTDLAVAEIEAMAASCAGADPSTPVPTCPGWDLAELMRHTGEIHRWAATMVEQSSQKRLKREQLDWGVPADPADLASPQLVTAFGHGKHTCPAQPFSLAAMSMAVMPPPITSTWRPTGNLPRSFAWRSSAI